MRYLKYACDTFLNFKHNSNSCIYQVPVSFIHFNLLDNQRKSFDHYLYQIISEVRSERKYLNVIPNLENVIQTTTKYNSRGKSHVFPNNTMLTSYYTIEKSENLSEGSIHQAFVLAWAAKMTDSYNRVLNSLNYNTRAKAKVFEVSDDIVQDADLLRSFMYAMIEHKFQDTKWYPDILHLFNKAFTYNRIGQYLEHSTRKQPNKYTNINVTQYQMLCDYKVSYPYFQLPIFLALSLANKSDTELLCSVGRICSDMGMLYQIKEDYENCFGTDVMSETDGTDIQIGKCTWLAVTALQRSTPRQRLVFEACYGSDEPAHLERVKVLYKLLQLPHLYREKEGALCENIMQQAETLEKSGIPYKLFGELLEAIRTQ